MNHANAAAIRKMRSLFNTFQQEVNEALKQLEYSNNVYSCTIPEMERIVNMVSEFYHVDSSDVMSRKRDAATSWARHVCMYLTVKTTKHAKRLIGQMFFKDHTSVIHAVKAVTNRMQTDKKAKADVEALQAKL